MSSLAGKAGVVCAGVVCDGVVAGGVVVAGGLGQPIATRLTASNSARGINNSFFSTRFASFVGLSETSWSDNLFSHFSPPHND
jgi:hypothetical protein